MITTPWGLTIKPWTKYKYEIPPFVNLKISNAALGAQPELETSRTTITIETVARLLADSEDEDELKVDEEELQPTSIVLTSLTPGKADQSIHDIIFSFPAVLTISSHGGNTIHLGGNLIAEPETDESDSEDGYLYEEDASDLDDVRPGVGVDADDIELDDVSTDGDRFEEVDSIPQAKAGQKRSREDDISEDEDENKAKPATLPKSQKKQLNKKLKAQSGEAIPTGAPSNEKKEKNKKPDSSPEVSKKGDKEGMEKKKQEKAKTKEEKHEKKEKKEKKTGTDQRSSHCLSWCHRIVG